MKGYKKERFKRKLLPPSSQHLYDQAADLESVLAGLGVGHVYVCGAQTNNCVRYTTHGALERGYDVTLLSDAHTTTDFETGGKKISAEFAVDEFNSSIYGEELPELKERAQEVLEGLQKGKI